MPNVILLHGHGGSPNSFWLPYTKKALEKRGHDVWSPQLPNTLNPNLAEQLPYLLQHGKFTPETIIIAHSSSCALVIALLEKLTLKIRQVLLVAAFIELPQQLKPFGLASILKEKYDWHAVREHVEELILINSNNDPFGCDDKQAQIILSHINGILVVPYGEGHMGSETINQPYKEFPLLLRLIANCDA